MKRIVGLLLAVALCISAGTAAAVAADMPDAPEPRFVDVPADAWYYDSVTAAVDAGILKGVTDTQFDPAGTLTRAMLITALWRMAGKPILTPEPGFAEFYFPNLDTDPIPEWALDAAVWAGFYGIVRGYPDKTFRANAPVTREQMVVILYRYAVYTGVEAVGAAEYVSGYRDSDSIAPYAIAAINWAIGAGVVNGEADLFEPQRLAERVDAATLLTRLQAALDQAQQA